VTNKEQQIPWEGQLTQASFEFGLRCRQLHETNPYGADERLPPVLVQVMSHLATELWDQRFSQSEIKAAFERAFEGLTTYCAGEERRGDRA
jgi:hypothetical protein